MRRSPRPHRSPTAGIATFLLLFTPIGAARAQDSTSVSSPPLAELSLEQLMNIEVSSVSRRQEPLFEATAAVDVVTADDIRRSGATSVAEALRLVVGMEVARTNASQWAISARGFNNQFADKLLVLVDGRSVYTPLFAGVYWDVQDLVLDQIDRIEVIRGPGATLWGANAVNGVINVITKRAADTPRAAVVLAGGTSERGAVSATFAGRSGERWAYRVFVKDKRTDEAVDAAGRPAGDDWRITHGGFRADFDARQSDLLTMQGDVYEGRLGQVVRLVVPAPPYSLAERRIADVAGGNLLGRWSHALSARSHTALQVYYDGTYRNDPFLAETRHTLDVDFQHDWATGPHHEIVWGAGYRLTADYTRATFSTSLNPSSRHDDLVSFFAQDEISMAQRRLRLTVGTKLENNAYTGFEVQPSARIAWTPNRRHTLWGATSGAVRTPSRVEDDVRWILRIIPVDTTLHFVTLVGNRDLLSDRLVAFEAGYRVHATRAVTLDVASYFDRYRRLGTFEPVPPKFEATPAPAHVLDPLTYANLGLGKAYGVEVATTLQLHSRWRLTAAASWFRLDLDREPESLDRSADAIEGNDPRAQFFVRSRHDLPYRLEFDALYFHVGELPNQAVPAYDRVDAVLGWAPTQRLRLSVVGQNLLEPQHPEFGSAVTSARATEVERGVYGKLSWRP